MIETEIGDDAINPCVKRTLESKTRKIDISPEKRLLIDVLTILLRASEVDGQPQHRTIVLPHQFFEGCGVSLLGLADQGGIIHTDRRCCPGWFYRSQYRTVQVRRSPNFAGLRHTHLSAHAFIRLPIYPATSSCVLAYKLVPRSVHGENETRLLRLRFDFLPQADDVRIHRASRGKAVVAPHVLQQAIAAQGFAGMAQEILEQLEFLG